MKVYLLPKPTSFCMSTNTAKRQIRVFLSSTFADMQDERNYLVKKSIPHDKG